MATAANVKGQPNNFGLGGNSVPTTVTGSSTGSGTSNSTTAGTTTGTTDQTTATDQTQTQNSTTTNMTSAQLAQLNSLIQSLMNGGTPELKNQVATRKAEQSNVAQQREAYSKNNAFSDAQGLIAQQMRRSLESMLPSINRAAEDAGSSGGALRALLLQDAADKASESASALGVQTAAQYGGISANLSQIMEQLTRVDPTVTNALIGALGVAKGSVTNTTGVTNTSGTQQTSGTTTQNTNNNVVTNTNDTKSLVQNTTPLIGQPASTSPIFFGSTQQTTGTGIGSTTDFLNQLYGNNAWENRVTF